MKKNASTKNYFVLALCVLEAGGFPTVFFLLYQVTLYDSVTGELICTTYETVTGASPLVPENCRQWTQECNQCSREYFGTVLACDAQACSTEATYTSECMAWLSDSPL